MVDFGVDDGHPFYITGNVDGETLRAYLARQHQIPVWLAVMIACRSLEAALAVCEHGDYLTDQPMESLRVVQTGPQSVLVMAADFRVIDGPAGRSAKVRLLKSNFERQGKFLKSFLQEQSGGGPTAPDTLLTAVDFGELLGGCLTAMGPEMIDAVKDLRNGLLRFAPEHLTGEIPTAQKPYALVAPLLASYQEVARGVVNLVRIQSQRLDMTNPYAMRGTLTRAGRQVWVEQIPPARVCGTRVGEVDRQLLKLAKKREFSSLVPVVLVNDAEDISCMAEEVAEGVSLAELLRERRGLDTQETYLVLAGIDSALSHVEKAGLPCRKLRLEDIYLLTGFAREDSRTANLLVSKINEWPTFTVTVRAHPSLASMSGRGTDPGVLLPLPASETAAGKTIWGAGWMAAMGRFLLGLETARGRTEAEPGNRERESVARLFDDEITKARVGVISSRADFLNRYARVVQHPDLVKHAGSEAEVIPAGARGSKQPVANGKGAGRKAEPAVQTIAAVSALSPGMRFRGLGGHAECRIRGNSFPIGCHAHTRGRRIGGDRLGHRHRRHFLDARRRSCSALVEGCGLPRRFDGRRRGAGTSGRARHSGRRRGPYVATADQRSGHAWRIVPAVSRGQAARSSARECVPPRSFPTPHRPPVSASSPRQNPASAS